MMRSRTWAALSGALAVGIGVIGGELTAAALSPSAMPVTAVGSTVIDVLPPGVKDRVVSWFGTADRAVLLACIAALVLALSLTVGVLEYRRPFRGRLVVLAVGLLGGFAVAARPQSSTVALVAPGVAILVALVGLAALTRLLRRRQSTVPDDDGGSSARRRFCRGPGERWPWRPRAGRR